MGVCITSITKHHLFRLATDIHGGGDMYALIFFLSAPLTHPATTRALRALVRSNNSGQTVIVSGGTNTPSRWR